MTALVACETVLLVLLSILVVGLLRSHAEILRRLGRPEADEGEALPPASAADSGVRAADDVAGVTPAGDAIQVGLGPGAPTTLLAFLGSGCSSCHELWEGLAPERRDLPGDLRVVVVAQDPARESPSRLRRLSPPDLPVVMSSAAWEHYGVPGSPYFVLVDGPSGRVSGEGAAVGWPQLTSLLHLEFNLVPCQIGISQVGRVFAFAFEAFFKLLGLGIKVGDSVLDHGWIIQNQESIAR